MVDAAIIGAPIPTKSKANQCDPEMHQEKGNQWYFGMKAHVGVDARTVIRHRDNRMSLTRL